MEASLCASRMKWRKVFPSRSASHQKASKSGSLVSEPKSLAASFLKRCETNISTTGPQ